MTNARKLICIGMCAGAFGVKGEVKIKSFTEAPDAVFAYGPLRDRDGDIFLSPISHREIKGGFATICAEVETREQAQAISGRKIYVYRDDMPAPDEDEFYFEDLIGLPVKTVDGKRAGRIKAVHNYGAGDLLEIAGGTDKSGKPLGDFYHPFTKQAVPVVDLARGLVVIAPVDSSHKTG